MTATVTATEGDPLDRLTARERLVLAMLGDGHSAADIALRHGMALQTVRTHIKAILAKLEVHSQLAAVARARRAAVPPGATGTVAVDRTAAAIRDAIRATARAKAAIAEAQEAAARAREAVAEASARLAGPEARPDARTHAAESTARTACRRVDDVAVASARAAESLAGATAAIEGLARLRGVEAAPQSE